MWMTSLDKEQLSRLKPVPDDLKELLLNADYALSMSVGDLLETGDTADYKETGMKWHD